MPPARIRILRRCPFCGARLRWSCPAHPGAVGEVYCEHSRKATIVTREQAAERHTCSFIQDLVRDENGRVCVIRADGGILDAGQTSTSPEMAQAVETPKVRHAR